MLKLIALLFMTTLIFPAFSKTLYGTASSGFDVKATVDSFVGKAVSEPFEIKSGEERVTVVYEIAKMETGKKKRDKEMLHMFHAEEFPQLSGSASSAAILALEPSEAEVDLPVEFVMHGVTNEVIGKVSNVVKTDEAVSFDLAFPLSLKEFDLKAPSIMMMIRVNNIVNVNSHVTLSKIAPSEPTE